jgi:hypothetical protein
MRRRINICELKILTFNCQLIDVFYNLLFPSSIDSSSPILVYLLGIKTNYHTDDGKISCFLIMARLMLFIIKLKSVLFSVCFHSLSLQ